MALIAVSGHPGCRFEEVARLAAHRLGFELLTQARLHVLAGEEFGAETQHPRPGLRQPDHFHPGPPGHRTAPGLLCRGRRSGSAPVRGDAAGARGGAGERADRQSRCWITAWSGPPRAGCCWKWRAPNAPSRKAKFGKARATADLFDLVLNAESLSSEQMAELIAAAVASAGLRERGYLSHAAEAQLQFQMRLKLARFGIVPPANITLRKKIFANPSEEMFANLLDFYRIAWEYEPRSFPIQLDRNGNALESFTPDFYLPEFDLYVELTTMKQSLVTRKNRKVRLLRQLYPQVNIQVFYQKDFENLIFKYGLAERPVQV